MRDRAVLVALIVLTVLVNWPVLSAGQVYEDAYYSQPNTTLHLRPSRLITGWTWALQASSSDTARHAVNLSVHVVNGLLVGALAASLGVSVWLAAGLFLLHPIQSEAAGYLASRGDLLMTAALLLMALALRQHRWIAAGCCAGLAMLCKESGVAAVGLLLLWPGCPRGLRMAGVVVASTGVFMAYGLLSAYGSFAWMCQQAAGLWGQIVGLVAPWTLMLAPDPLPFTWLETLALFAVCALVLAWSWSVPVRRLACLWIVACLALRFVIPTPHSVLNSHQVYAAMVGVCLWIGSLHAVHPVQQVRIRHAE